MIKSLKQTKEELSFEASELSRKIGQGIDKHNKTSVSYADCKGCEICEEIGLLGETLWNFESPRDVRVYVGDYMATKNFPSHCVMCDKSLKGLKVKEGTLICNNFECHNDLAKVKSFKKVSDSFFKTPDDFEKAKAQYGGVANIAYNFDIPLLLLNAYQAVLSNGDVDLTIRTVKRLEKDFAVVETIKGGN